MLANSEKKFKKFNFRKSLITDHGSYQHISFARWSFIIVQILVADHGSQIAERILEASNFREKNLKIQF